jgi:ATP-dependent DNA ligase
MNAQTLKGNKFDKVLEDPDYMYQAKLKGMRATMYISDETKIFSRGEIDYTHKLPHLCKRTYPLSWYGTILEGELLWPDHTDAELAGLMHRIDEEDTSFVEFHCFDILQKEHLNLVNWSLQARLAAIPENLESWGIYKLPWFTGSKDDKLSFYEAIISSGGEGIMLKNLNSLYHPAKKPGQRPPVNTWYKLKTVETHDVVIMDYIPGKGKYTNLIGALVFGKYTPSGELKEIGSCSGINDELRTQITFNWDSWKGRVIEVECMEELKSGALKHPRFIRLREDKRPEECVI